MKAAAKNGQFVLENRMGQVVRTFRIEAPKFALIYREDTGRIESHTDVKDLEDDGVEFTILAEINQKTLTKEPVAIGETGTLRFVEDVEKLTPRHELEEEKDEFRTLLKRIAAVNVGILAFCLTINYFFPANPEIEEPVVVTIDIPKPEMPKPKPKAKTVAVSEKKIQPTKRKIKVVERKAPKPKITNAQRKTSTGKNRKSTKVAKNGVNINQVGALAALGSRSNAPVTGGTLNLKNVSAKLGSGGGGTGMAGAGGLGRGGKGGFANALGGKGLAAASRGTGGGVGLPSGGYGTRGRAGGQNGYGRTNLAGSGDGYFQPLEQEAEVEGGLDRDQINEVIQRNMGQILYCYEQGLQVKSSLAGRVGVRFTINGGGRVSTAGVAHSSMRSAQVEGCILSKLRAFRFPQPVGGVNVKVSYPFQFQRVSQR